MTALEMFQNRLQKLKKDKSKWASRHSIFCYRVYDEDIPQVPVILEKYEEKLVLWDRSSLKHQTEEEQAVRLKEIRAIVAKVFSLPLSEILVKVRKKQKGLEQYNRLDFAKEEITVREADCFFKVNVSDYLDTGLFLDHRWTRQFVKSLSQNKKVLNLFSYTGSFSVAALKGGASHLTQVDLSNSHLDWAERNLDLNGFSPKFYQSIRADILDWVDSEIQNKTREKYDLIFVDPPTFSNSKKMETHWEVESGHIALLKNLSTRFLRPGGILLFSTNFRKFKMGISPEEWQELGFIFESLTEVSIPEDFRNPKVHQLFQIRFDSLD